MTDRALPEGMRTFVALICKRCGGISDGPIDERNGVCTCADENEAHYEPVSMFRVADLPKLEAAFRERAREALRSELRLIEGEVGAELPHAGFYERSANILTRFEKRLDGALALDSDTPSEEKCYSCGEDQRLGECPKSKRACGHHCNCSWVNDLCHWCGKEFGAQSEEETTMTEKQPNDNPCRVAGPVDEAHIRCVILPLRLGNLDGFGNSTAPSYSEPIDTFEIPSNWIGNAKQAALKRLEDKHHTGNFLLVALDVHGVREAWLLETP